ncbi:MAG: hypothetical protein ACOX8B_09610 [Lachnospiraceae bacterium]|jgi:hypothetical protein
MRKKIIAVILTSMIAAAGLAGCGKEDANAANAETTEETANASESAAGYGDWKDNIGYTLTPFNGVSYEDIYFARVAVSEDDMGEEWNQPWYAFNDMLMQDDNAVAYKEIAQNFNPDEEESEESMLALFDAVFADFGKTPADVFGDLSMYECTYEYVLDADGAEMNDDQNHLYRESLYSCTEIPDSELSETFIRRGVFIDYDGNHYEGDNGHAYCYYDKKNGIQYILSDTWEAYQAGSSLGSNTTVGSLIKSPDAMTLVSVEKEFDGYRAKYTTPISNIQSESNLYEGFIESMPDDMEAPVYIYLYKDGTLKSIEIDARVDKDSFESEPFTVRDDDTFKVTSLIIKADYSIPAYEALDGDPENGNTSATCPYRTDIPSKDDEVRFDYTEADANFWLYGGNDSIQTPQDYVDYFDVKYMTGSEE